MRDDQARLEDILRAIGHIERYARRGRSHFDSDELLQAWMIHHLAVIGEAAARLSLTLRESHPEVPWSGTIGMRNVLVHGYFTIDLDEVWGTVEQGVPALCGSRSRRFCGSWGRPGREPSRNPCARTS